ncbi:MAG TPA: hypothetical protein VLN49_13090 [Gemmatimonadaceae bacterium]|nr:hypothetical protein [Gemmatimonadaceae bacterium]
MDLYHIALFLHVVTLMVAASATAVTKLAVGRRARARTVGEALDWHNVLVSTSKAFPICLAAFVLTGSYMVSVSGTRAWSSGFVVAGLVGVVLLLGSGTFLGIKARALTQVIETIAQEGMDRPAPKLVPPPLVGLLPMVNTGISLGVVYDMATKPASVPVALTVTVIGAALTTAIAMRGRTALVTQGAPATQV